MRRVRLLVELERRGSLSAVAEALHLSPSGISAQIARLEREVGAVLVVRVGRGLRLTDAGRRLADRGRQILASMEAAESDLRALSGEVTGTVRVGAFQSAALLLVPPALATVAEHPLLRVELVQAEPEAAVPALLAGDLDLVIAEEYADVRPWLPDDVHREVLGPDPLDVAVTDELLRGRALAAAGADLPWVLELPGSAAREWAELTCRRLGFEPDVRFQSDDLLVHLALIRGGRAAGMLPSLLLAGEDTGLRRMATGSSRLLLTLVRDGTEGRPAIRRVRDALDQAFRTADPAVPLPGRAQ